MTRRLVLIVALVFVALGVVTAQRVRLRIIVPASGGGGGGSLQSHPRLLLTSAVISAMQAKHASNTDTDWEAFETQENANLSLTLPTCTVTGATNANPVVFTCSEDVSFTTTATVGIAGGTGNWAGVNTANYTTVTGTKTGTKTFSIPVNSTSYGSFSGQTLSVFQLDGEGAGYLGYAQYGEGYLGALSNLAIMYRVTGTASYLTKALAILDFVNTFGATNNRTMQWQDAGRAGSLKTVNIALAYDWLFPYLSAGQKTATQTTVTMLVDYITTYGGMACGCVYSWTDPTSNYFMAHQTLLLASAYAVYDEVGAAATWLTTAQSRWTTYVAPLFAAPSTSSPAIGNGTGAYYEGLNYLGENYGGNDIARHLKYMLMVGSATGTPFTNLSTYATAFARAAIHEWKPDRAHTFTVGRWTGDYYGVPSKGRPLLLSYTLGSATEGGWMQWAYANLSGNFQVADLTDRVLFYDSAKTAVDYTATATPYGYVDGSTGILYARTGWSTSDTYTYFRAAPGLIAADIPRDGGHVELTRGADNLTFPASFCKGTTTCYTGTPNAETYGSGQANTLFFDDGGARCFTPNTVGSQYYGCQIGFYQSYVAPTRFTSSNYVFGLNDFAPMYAPNVGATSRTLNYFYRSFLTMGDGLVFVWDRSKSTSGGYTKEIRWHVPGSTTPTCTGAVCTTGTVGSSKLFIQPLMPDAVSPSLQIVRNTTHNGGTDYTNYRVVVTDPQPGQTFNVLSVLEPVASGGSQSTTTALVSDSNFFCAQVEASTPQVSCMPVGVTDNGSGSFSSTTYTSASFVTTHSGTAKVAVWGLTAGTYTTRRNGSSLSQPCTISTNQPCYFTAASGTITVN